MRISWIALTVLLASGGYALAAEPPVCPAPKSMRFQLDHVVHRDMTGFTEGLEVHNRDIYESTGKLGGGTRLMRITPEGHVTVVNDSGQKFFGEGLTFLGGRVYQLSWQEHQVFVYDRNFRLLRTLHNPHDGWGLTNDGRYLIYGDGGDQLYYAEPDNFTIKGAITVRRGEETVDNLNELEYVKGEIYANLWTTRKIVRIDARTGCIDAEADLSILWDHMTAQERRMIGSDEDFVLNGIAYDPATELFTLTGKEWPMLFSGRFLELEAPPPGPGQP